MSIPISSSKTTEPIVDSKPTINPQEVAARAKIAELMALPLKEREAKVSSIYDRGILNDRFKVDVPSDMHYEWVRDDPNEIADMVTKGFWLDTNYATQRQLNSDGTSTAKIGDVVCMVTMLDNKKLHDKVKLMRQQEVQNGTRGKDKEDREFKAGVARETGGDIPAFADGTTKTVDMNSLRETLAAANAQAGIK